MDSPELEMLPQDAQLLEERDRLLAEIADRDSEIAELRALDDAEAS